MGYISNDIALIGEPERLTLSSVPNFITISSKPGITIPFEANLIVLPPRDSIIAENFPTNITISMYDGPVFEFISGDDGNFNYSRDDAWKTAESLRRAMLSVNDIRTNYNVTIASEWVGNVMVNGSVINIRSKSAGMQYDLKFNVRQGETVTLPDLYKVEMIQEHSVNSDTLTGNYEKSVQIDLDVYIDSNVFMGEDDRGTSPEKIGTYLTTLSKTYACRPIWFDLNKLFSQNVTYSCPCGKSNWFDPGTMRTFMFFLKMGSNNTVHTLYQSNTLYVLNGYGPLTEHVDLQEYVYSEDRGKVKLLTNQPRIRYVRGQGGYLNFLFSDPDHSNTPLIQYRFDLIYSAYSNSGEYLGGLYDHGADRSFFHMANTCRLNIDRVIEVYPSVGLVKVGLARNSTTVSNMLEFEVVPETLHSLCPFTFLNRLGGWDCYNFDATVQGEFKVKSETYNKVVTPAFKKGDSIESVYSRNLEETFTVEGSPVNKEVRDWLYEFAASKAVYDGDGNYVIVDDMSFDPVQGSDLYRPVMKYHLSEERYNND